MQLDQHGYANRAFGDQYLAKEVSKHKSLFFREKDANGVLISYNDAVTGKLRLVPQGDIASAIRSDYEKMTESDLIYSENPTYDDLLAKLADIEGASK